MEVGLMERRMHQNNGHVDNTITNFGRAPFTDLSPNKDMHRDDDKSAQQQQLVSFNLKNQRTLLFSRGGGTHCVYFIDEFFFLYVSVSGGWFLIVITCTDLS